MKVQRTYPYRVAVAPRVRRAVPRRGIRIFRHPPLGAPLLFTGSGDRVLAEAIATRLGIRPGKLEIARFASSEAYVRVGQSVRGKDVFVVQAMRDTVDQMLMEQLIVIDALKRASARQVTAVCPLYPYSRQDRKARGREPITARLVADLYEAAGADRILSVDLHAPQIQGFFHIPFDHLTALPLLADHVAEAISGGIVIVAPDAGAVRIADRWARHLSLFHNRGSDLAYLHKRRVTEKRNVSEVLAVVGDVRGKHCVLVDDMVDTAATLVNGAEALMRAGARDVVAAATHPILSGGARERLKASAIKELVVADTVPVPRTESHSKVRVLSIAPLIAAAIREIWISGSVSSVFHGENV